MIFSGAPAATAASRTILAAAAVDFLALGCGRNNDTVSRFKRNKGFKNSG